MPGLFDMLMGLAGRPDPSMQLMAALGQAPGQPGGGPPVAGAPAPPQGQAGGGAPNPAQGAPQAGPGQQGTPPATMPGGQQAPNAFQSPSDLSSMYLQMVQRQQASNQFNTGLGLLAASAYPGRRPDIIMNAMRGMNTQDPAETFGNLMKLQMYGQQQQRYQQLQQAVPGMLDKAGIDQSFAPLVASDPEIMAKVLETQIGVGGSPAWQAQIRAERAMTAQGQQIPWTPGDPSSYDAWTKANATQKVAEAKDTQSDRDAFTSADGDYRQTEQLLGWLKAHPDATAAAVQNGAMAAGRTGQFREWLGSLPGGLPTDTATAAGFLSQLQGKLYSDSWKGRGGRLSQLEAGKISQGFSQLDNPAMPSDQINQQIGDLYNKTLTSHANTYGAAGMPTPSDYYGHMDDQYKTGGKLTRGATELDKSGSGSGAGIPAALNARAAPAASPIAAPVAGGGGAQAADAPTGGQKLSADDLEQAKALIARDGRDAVIAHLKAKGYDTSGL